VPVDEEREPAREVVEADAAVKVLIGRSSVDMGWRDGREGRISRYDVGTTPIADVSESWTLVQPDPSGGAVSGFIEDVSDDSETYHQLRR